MNPNGKRTAKFVGGGFVAAIILVGALLSAFGPIGRAITLPEKVQELERHTNDTVKGIYTEIREIKDRREQERLLLSRLETELGYIRRSVESIERQQRRFTPATP
jgi:septation ring formation regulator EzrA